MSPRLRAFLIRTALAFGGTLSALVVLELALALQPRSIEARMQINDPYIGYRHVPGGVFDYKKEDFSVRVRFNSLGFHDREHNVTKPPGMFRVVVLGDSFMDALQVDYEDTFAHRLEQELRRLNVSAEVINLGMRGFQTQQELLTLERYGSQFQPDLVLLAFFVNDVLDNRANASELSLEFLRSRQYETPVEGEFFRRLPDFAQVFARLAQRVFPNTYVLVQKWLWSQWGDKSDYYPDPYNNLRADSPPSLREGWNRTEQYLRQARDQAAARDAKFFLFYIPLREAVYPDLWRQELSRYPPLRNLTVDFDSMPRALSSIVAEEDIPFLDLGPGFREYANRTGQYTYFTGALEAHWNAAGHRVAAALVAEALVRQGAAPRLRHNN